MTKEECHPPLSQVVLGGLKNVGLDLISYSFKILCHCMAYFNVSDIPTFSHNQQVPYTD